MGGIEYFRGNDIQAYTPPTGPRKPAESPPAPPAAQTPPAEEAFGSLGDLKGYDVDGNGKVTKDEFSATRGGELLRAKAAKEQELFKRLDANGDTKLSNDEFLRAFSQLGEDATVSKVRGHIDGEFDQRKASDGTIHVDPRVQAGGGDTAPPPAEKKETREVTVKAGDTLNKIAQANGLTLADLKEANPDLFKNGPDSSGKRRTSGGDLIYPGDKIKLPVKAEKKEGADKAAPRDTTQAKLLGSLDERLGTLQTEKDKLAKDLQDPNRKAEAQARMNLLDMQMAALTGIKQHVSAYRPAANPSAEDSKKIQEVFGTIDQLSKDLSHPAKLSEVRSQLALAYNFLENPKLYDPKAPKGTTDPTLLSQATAIQSMDDRIAGLVREMDRLVPDLANPARRAEAQARTNLLTAQVQTLMRFEGRVYDFRNPGNLSPAQAQKATDLLKQIDGQAALLSNPMKTADAQAQLLKLLDALEKTGK